MRKSWLWFFLALVCTGLGLVMAIYYLRTQLVFGYDQARDAFEAYAIWHNRDLKILGPATDIPGVSHGVLWYYFLAVVNFLGKTPQNGALIALLAFFLSVPIVGWVTAKLFKNPPVTYLTVSLYALSPLFQVFTRWLSNPTLALLITPLFLISFWSYLQKPRKLFAFFSGLFFGALIQAQFAYAILLLTLPVYLWYFKSRLRLDSLVAFAGGLLLAVGSFIVAEVKFGGRTMRSLIGFLVKSDSNPGASGVVLTIFDRVFEMLSQTVLAWPKLGGIILLLVLLIALKKTKLGTDRQPIAFLVIWSLGYILFQFFSTAVAGSAHVFVVFIFPVAAVFAYFLFQFVARFPKGVILILLLLAGQIGTNLRWVAAGFSPHSAQRGAFLHYEEEAVDYTYKEAKGQPFILNSVTNPLYINTTWAYLYQFYGQEKYGYLPYWGGLSQTGRLGNLPEKPFGEGLRFLIIEDTNIIAQFYVAKITYEEDKVSDVVDEREFGKIKVQKRIFHPDKGPVPMPPELLRVTPDLLE